MADTPDRSELRRRLDRATETPWFRQGHLIHGPDRGGTDVGPLIIEANGMDDDLTLLVVAVNALPALLDALDSRDALLDRARSAVKMAIGLAKSEPEPREYRIRFLETLRDDIDEARAALGGSDDA